MIQIDTTGRIIIDSKETGLSIRQEPSGTAIYSTAGECRVHKMPHARYSTAHDAPVSGVAGRGELERDVRDLLGKMEGV